MPRCREKNARGEPCGSPEHLVDPATGLCPAHAPGGRERMLERARKGGEAARKAWSARGLEPEDLPPLRGSQDAEVWLERIGRAVVTGKLANRDADAATRAIKTWLSAHDAGQVAEDVEKLRRLVAELKGRKLERVK